MLLDTPLDAPGLRRMKMKTRTAEDSKGAFHNHVCLKSICMSTFKPDQACKELWQSMPWHATEAVVIGVHQKGQGKLAAYTCGVSSFTVHCLSQCHLPVVNWMTLKQSELLVMLSHATLTVDSSYTEAPLKAFRPVRARRMRAESQILLLKVLV